MVASEKSKKQKSGKAEKLSKPAATGSAKLGDYALMIKPILTEKASTLEGKDGASVVAFKVQRDSSKLEIKAAIERVFNVQVASVRTINVMGKIKRAGKSSGRRAASKKAYVTLKPGHTIDIVEGV